MMWIHWALGRCSYCTPTAIKQIPAGCHWFSPRVLRIVSKKKERQQFKNRHGRWMLAEAMWPVCLSVYVYVFMCFVRVCVCVCVYTSIWWKSLWNHMESLQALHVVSSTLSPLGFPYSVSCSQHQPSPGGNETTKEQQEAKGPRMKYSTGKRWSLPRRFNV